LLPHLAAFRPHALLLPRRAETLAAHPRALRPTRLRATHPRSLYLALLRSTHAELRPHRAALGPVHAGLLAGRAELLASHHPRPLRPAGLLPALSEAAASHAGSAGPVGLRTRAWRSVAARRWAINVGLRAFAVRLLPLRRFVARPGTHCRQRGPEHQACRQAAHRNQ
jgi:hypothetical protein